MTTTRNKNVTPSIPTYSDAAGSTMNALSVDELRKRQDSLMENIGAFRFSIAKVEYLIGMQRLCRDLLSDCRIPLKAHGFDALCKQIDRVLKETAADNPTEDK
jgi:hypothetical protein